MSKPISLAEIISHPFVGDFDSDSAAIMKVYSFVENKSNTMSDRAAALRHLAVAAYGFDGVDAGQGVDDAIYVQQYMDNR